MGVSSAVAAEVSAASSSAPQAAVMVRAETAAMAIATFLMERMLTSLSVWGSCDGWKGVPAFRLVTWRVRRTAGGGLVFAPISSDLLS